MTDQRRDVLPAGILVSFGHQAARWVETCLRDCHIRPLPIDNYQVIQDVYGDRAGARVRTYVTNTPRGWREALRERTGLAFALRWTMTTTGRRVRYIEMLVPRGWTVGE